MSGSGELLRRVEARIGGRVQGVGFRWHVLRAAEAAGVFGWVRNRDDGDVELLAEGNADGIAAFLEVVRGGPQAAVVERFEVRDVAPSGGERGFRVRL